MQITHNWKTYKWIGKYWWEKDITDVWKISVTYWEVWFTDKYQWVLRTYHTPEQLVKLWYMELIETKPEEKPTEHWVNCEHCIEQSPHTAIDHYKCKCGNWLTFYWWRGGSWSMCEKCWYDSQNVDQPDHDKAMDEAHWVEEKIQEVAPLYIKKVWDWACNPEVIDVIFSQLELLTKSLNLVIKKINNL